MRRLSVIGVGLLGLAAALLAPVLAPAAAALAADQAVQVVDNAFQPQTITVPAGTTITWTNTGKIPHTVTADDKSFDSGNLAPGQTFSHTFATAATVGYHCQYHGAPGSGMFGQVVVAAAAGAQPTVAPTSAPAAPTAAPTRAPAAAPTSAAAAAPRPTTAPTAAPGVTPTSAPAAGQLPNTGGALPAGPLAAFASALGLLGLGAGYALRRRHRA